MCSNWHKPMSLTHAKLLMKFLQNCLEFCLLWDNQVNCWLFSHWPHFNAWMFCFNAIKIVYLSIDMTLEETSDTFCQKYNGSKTCVLFGRNKYLDHVCKLAKYEVWFNWKCYLLECRTKYPQSVLYHMASQQMC